MMNDFDNTVLNMAQTMPEPEDYTGEDGLLYCGKCRKPKERYFPEGKQLFGRDRHPAECDCQRAEREKREAAEKRRTHLEAVRRLKQRGFTNEAMQEWTFANDNGFTPQMNYAHAYVDEWEAMKADNIGYLLWGGCDSGKSYLAGCIANALMEKEVLDDLGIERDTEYAHEHVYNVIDSRYRSGKPLIVTTNLPLEALQHPKDTPHARIYSRVIEMCVPIRCTGRQNRKVTAQRKMERLKALMNGKEVCL